MTEDIVKWEDRHPIVNDPIQAQQADLVLVAMQKGYDPALISQMMDLRDREEKRQALQAYVSAMSRFKESAPEIDKDKTVSYQAGGKTVEYNHASLANICRKVSPLLAKEGLHASWKTDQQGGIIKVICTITHEMGHSESISLDAAPDNSGSKNSIQAVGSTISYLERYTLLALLGLATSDMDDDGDKADDKKEYITESQVKEIKKIIEDKNIDTVPFFKWAKVSKIEDITAKAFKEVVEMLKAAKGRPKVKPCPEKSGKDATYEECEKCEAKKAGMCASWS